MYERKSRGLLSLLLKRISSIGDTYEQHKDNLDYKSFLEIQLELIKRIIKTERRISKLRNERPKPLNKIKEAKERRSLLKLLGTTIAWILLEFDRPYIRTFATGHDPGFIYGKKGLKLELLALKSAFEYENHAAILHDITNCLRIGDLSIIGPQGILTLELKLRKEKRKMDRRERRQKRKAEIIREFYDKGISTKIISGWKIVRHLSKKRDKHNWSEICAVIEEAIKNGYGIRIVDKCLIYFAFKNEILGDVLSRYIKLFRDPYFMFGCLDRHIVGLPSIMPFTCFEIPFQHKEKLFFKEVNLCVILDINSLSRILEENGFHCKILKNSDKGVLEIFDIGKRKSEPIIIGYGLINRLLYECLSVKTFVDYAKEVSEKFMKEEILK